MAEYIELIAFTICYATAFCLEIGRYFRKTPALYWSILVFTALGACLQTLYIKQYFVFQDNKVITSVGGWFFILILGLTALNLYLLVFHRRNQYGLFLFPVVFLLTIIAINVSHLNFPAQQTGNFVRGFHAVTLVMATCCVLIGFLTGGMYLLQRNRLKRNKPLLRGLILPSLETLEYANRKSVKISIIFLGLGILSGFYINHLVAASTPGGTGTSLFDPMITGAIILFCFMTGFLVLTTCTNFFQGGQATAILTIACFLFLLSILLVGTLVRHAHWLPAIPQSVPVGTSQEDHR
ncbi:MAG: hypothetical protein PHQ75_03700 [Thermoguttaceae bacterium]|nr:hypothetical protein [Thermoguttaceae bacterium]